MTFEEKWAKLKKMRQMVGGRTQNVSMPVWYTKADWYIDPHILEDLIEIEDYKFYKKYGDHYHVWQKFQEEQYQIASLKRQYAKRGYVYPGKDRTWDSYLKDYGTYKDF